MKAIRSFLGLFADSPTYGRDRASLLSGLSIGTAALLLNGAVLMLVLPLMIDPDDHDLRLLTENVEFGQLLALILLGGAAAFATFLIPLRLISVFWGPRMGRYFDQVVLTGISPLRFVIGKATSQNLFLGLVLFLLLPYLVLSLTLGGVDPILFLAGLFLVWLYCLALALVTLWLCLYVNDLVAAAMAAGGGFIMSVLGCLPIPVQPFVLTPFPALIHPVYSSMPWFDGQIPTNFWLVFGSCVIGLTTVSAIALCAIYIGPLYGIIRENSTFGEVVRTGDNKKKRWFRLRLHIQRPSEIAFFYENRGDAWRNWEGLIRWGVGLGGLLLLSGGVTMLLLYILTVTIAARGAPGEWFAYEFHTMYLVIHGVGLVLGVFLFSHARNTTYLRIPVVPGVKARVATLDTFSFLVFLIFSGSIALATPYYFDQIMVASSTGTVFPAPNPDDHQIIDFGRVSAEGTLTLTLAGLVLYTLHRFGCLLTWLKSLSFAAVTATYFFVVCMAPMLMGALFMEVREMRSIPLFEAVAPKIASVSPVAMIGILFDELGDFPATTTAPFYILHVGLLLLLLRRVRRTGRHVQELYRQESDS